MSFIFLINFSSDDNTYQKTILIKKNNNSILLLNIDYLYKLINKELKNLKQN